MNNELIAQGCANSVGIIRDVVGIRLTKNIRIPYVSDADNDYKRVSMNIKELTGVTALAHENARVLFWFRPEVDNRWIELQYEHLNDGFVRFRYPITRIETLTLTFGSPLEPITFDNDRDTIPVTSYAAVTTFTATTAHNLATGDTVYVPRFTTENPQTDGTIVSAIRSIKGHSIIVVNPTTFTIPVDSTAIRVSGGGTVSVTVTMTTVQGAGTSFLTFFRAGDVIEIVSVKYKIASVVSDILLVLAAPYTGATAGGLAYFRDNALTSNFNVFFGSKRLFICMELEYLSDIADN
jgi:hypothetical protein